MHRYCSAAVSQPFGPRILTGSVAGAVEGWVGLWEFSGHPQFFNCLFKVGGLSSERSLEGSGQDTY